MPIRQSRLPFSIGTDVTRISRFSHYFAREPRLDDGSNKIYRLFDKFLTGPEQRLFWHKFGALNGLRHDAQASTAATQYLAGRLVLASNVPSDRSKLTSLLSWAAKEAIIKAYTARRLLMLDIEIHARIRSAPLAIVLDRRRLRFGNPEESQARQISKHWRQRTINGGSEGDPVESDHSRTIEGREEGESIDIHDRTLPVPGDTDGDEVAISLSHDADVCVAMAIVRLDMSDAGSVAEVAPRSTTSGNPQMGC